MRKSILALFIFSMAVLTANSQILPDWNWAKAIGGKLGANSSSILMDNEGNMYVSGSTYSAAKGKGSVILTDTTAGLFVAKFSAAGDLIWKASLNLKDNLQQMYLASENIMLDKDNNLYFTVGGWGRTGSVDSVSVVLNANIQKEFMFVVYGYFEQPEGIIKFDKDGNFKYLAGISGFGSIGGKKKGASKGGSQNLMFNSSVVDPAGNLYVAGTFMLDSLMLGNITIYNSQQNKNSLVTKIDTAGNFTWATIDSSTDQNLYTGSEANSIILGSQGNPIVFGDYTSSDRKFGNFTLTQSGAYNLYFASLDKNTGAYNKVIGSNGQDADNARKLVMDSNGKIYATGFTNSTSLFGQPASANATYDAFLLSLDSSLNILWTKIVNIGLGDLYYDYPLKLSVGADNHPVLAGDFLSKTLNVDALSVTNLDTISITHDYFIARFDTSGNCTYLNSLGTKVDDFDYNSVANVSFNVGSNNLATFIVPLTDTAFYAGTDTISYPAGSTGFIITEFDTTGKLLGMKTFISDLVQSFYVQCSNIVQSYSGYLGIAGNFYSQVVTLGSIQLQSADSTNYSNMFVAKMGYTLSGTIYDQNAQPVSTGEVKLFVLAQNGPANVIDSAQITATGNYKFSDAPLSGSLLFATTDTSKYQYYVGTYSGNSALWTTATILDLFATNPSAFDITLKQILPLTGPGIISGTVSQTLDTTSGSKKGLKSTGRPMKGASVVLIGKSTKGADTIIAITYTGDNGFYQFTKIPVGDYKVWIDVTGLGMLEYYAVSISDVSPEVANADYIVTKDGIIKDLSSGIRSIHKQNPGLAIYPNPAADFMHALIPGNTAGRIEIYNVSGLLMKSITLDAGRSADIIIGTSELSPGMYLLKASLTGKPALYGHFMKL